MKTDGAGRFVCTLRYMIIRFAVTFQRHHLSLGQPFPPNFLHIAQAVVKRLFRVYAHVYHQHLELIGMYFQSFLHFLHNS